jgi:hypothetical protein
MISKSQLYDLSNASCMATDVTGNKVWISIFFFKLIARLKLSVFVPTHVDANTIQLLECMNGKVENTGVNVHDFSVPLQCSPYNTLLA